MYANILSSSESYRKLFSSAAWSVMIVLASTACEFSGAESTLPVVTGG